MLNGKCWRSAVLVLALCTGTASAQPSNDSCESPLALPVEGGTFTVDTLSATSSASDPSCIADSRTVWFTYTAPANGRINVSTCGSEMYAGLAIYDSCDTELVCDFRNDDCPGDGQGSIQEFPMVAGQTILIVVGEYPYFQGRTFLNLTPQFGPAPANDECATATAAVNGTYTVDNTMATGEAAFGCQLQGGRPPRGDVWYRYTSPVTGLAQAEFNEGTLRTVLMEVTDGCGGSPLACFNGEFGASRVVWNAAAGQSYLIRVSGVRRGNPNYGVGSITFSNPQPPANDRCENAQAVTLGYTEFNTSYAATDQGAPPCIGADEGDVFFSFTPPTTMFVFAATGYGRPMDSAAPDSFAIYDSCGGNLIACDNQDSNVMPEINFLAEAGRTYIMRVASTYQRGWGGLQLTQVAMPAANDECEGAIDVLEGVTTFDTTRFVAGAYTSADPLYCFGDPLPGSAESPFNNDLWYAFTPDHAGTFSLRVIDGNWVAEVYDGCDGSPVMCTTGYGVEPSGYGSRTGCFDAQAGQRYLIRVGQDFFTGGGRARFVIEELHERPFEIPGEADTETEGCDAPDFNGGCLVDSENPQFDVMNVCIPMSATLAFNNEWSYPDIDAYRLTLQGGVQYVFDGQTEARAMFWIAQQPTCWERNILAMSNPDATCTFSFSQTFTAPETGTYEVLVQLEDGTIDCFVPNRYWVRVAPVAGCGCPADFNADGFLDFFDYSDYVGCFEGSGCSSGDPLAADFNRDGFVDFFDYSDFVLAFETGC